MLIVGCPLGLQVLYNAQMIRTFSLLLRSAQRLGYIVNGRQVDFTPLMQTNFVVNEAHTVVIHSTERVQRPA